MSCHSLFVFFFKQKTAYEMRISDWSSDVALPIFISDSASSLPHDVPANPKALQAVDLRQRLSAGSEHNGAWKDELVDAVQAAWRVMWINRFRTALTQIGRASCRERVCQYL